MSTYEIMGFFWCIFCVAIATAAAMICCGVGAVVIYRTWKDGVDQREFDKITRP